MPFDLSRRALVAGAAAMLPTLAFAQGKPPAPGTSVLTGFHRAARLTAGFRRVPVPSRPTISGGIP